MLKADFQGIQLSLDLDTTAFTGDPVVDSQLPYVQGLKAGRAVSLDAAGKVKLYDGLAANNDAFLGFLTLDAAGGAYLNRPAMASKKVSAIFGVNTLTSDQIATGVTFVPRDLVYVGTGANVGLLVKVPPAGGKPLGVVERGNTVGDPTVRFHAYGPV